MLWKLILNIRISCMNKKNKVFKDIKKYMESKVQEKMNLFYMSSKKN